MWKILLVLNMTKHRVTQYSALILLVRRDAATLLIQSLVGDVALKGASPNREALREMSRQRASERLRQNQEQQDSYVNMGRKPPRAFKVDSLVFVRKQAQATGKMDSCMRGPYRVMKILPHGWYKLQLLAGSYGKSTQAAAEYMIPWRGEWTPEVCVSFFNDASPNHEESTAIVVHGNDSPSRATEPAVSGRQQASMSRVQGGVPPSTPQLLRRMSASPTSCKRTSQRQEPLLRTGALKAQSKSCMSLTVDTLCRYWRLTCRAKGARGRTPVRRGRMGDDITTVAPRL